MNKRNGNIQHRNKNSFGTENKVKGMQKRNNMDIKTVNDYKPLHTDEIRYEMKTRYRKGKTTKRKSNISR